MCLHHGSQLTVVTPNPAIRRAEWTIAENPLVVVESVGLTKHVSRHTFRNCVRQETGVGGRALRRVETLVGLQCESHHH